MLKELQKDIRLWFLIGITIILFVTSLCVGSVNIPFSEIFNYNYFNQSFQKIIWEYRLPRSLTAICIGIALPISGWVLQEYFKNPLAGPSVLGVTSTAGLGVAFMILLGSTLGLQQFIYSSWALTLAGLCGAFISMLILLWVTQHNFSTTALIIVGFMLATFSGAVVSFLSYFSCLNDLKYFVLWSFGSINNLSNEKIIYFVISILLGLMIVVKNIPSLIKLQLGEMYAATMGVNIKSLRLQLIIATSILTGICTALVGPIAFIGLAVPHICRMYLKTSNLYLLFAHIMGVGICLMLFFTIISVVSSFGILPINIITSLFGVPIVLHIIFKNKRMWNE